MFLRIFVYPFFYELFNSYKQEIEKNLDLNVLKLKIQLYAAENNIITLHEEDFRTKINELFEDIRTKLQKRIGSKIILNYQLKKEQSQMDFI